MTKQGVVIGLLGFLLLCGATRTAAEEFTYRGVKFGMTREELSKLVPLEDGTNRAAGRKSFADKKVTFQFDDKGQVYAIEFEYWIPEPARLMQAALRRALQKKYAVASTSEKVWDLGYALMSFDEIYTTNPVRYLRTTITHKRLYEEYLDRVAVQFAPSLQD